MPKVAIVVLFYNDPQDVQDCLGSLTKIDYPREDFDILAIDNFSPNMSAGEIRKNFSGDVILIETDKNLGYSGANNLGIKYALKNNFDYVYILNPDTEVEPDFLTKAVKLAEQKKEIGLVQSKILLWGERNKIQTSGNKIHYTGICYSGGFNQLDNIGSEPFEIGYASGAGMLIKKEVFEKIGILNEKYFMYHEDVDFGWLAHLYGFEVLTEPKSVVYHKYNFSRNNQKFYWMERNRWWVTLKNYKIGTLIVLAPALVALEIMLLVYSLLGGWFNLKLRSYLGVIIGLKDIWQKRQIVQHERQISDRQFLKFTTPKLEFSGMTEGALIGLVNLFFKAYFAIAKRIIWW
ncbi:MAG: glycosyltransferase family 2 protein [Patescibacteria group bacterium]